MWTGGKSRPHRDSIPVRPARSQSLYRLSYPGHGCIKWVIIIIIIIIILKHILRRLQPVCGRSLAGIVSSNAAGGKDVCLL